MEGARHDQAVSLLTGLDRFVRLVVMREAGEGTRGAPYNAKSYMANRPSYTGYRRAHPTARLNASTLSTGSSTTVSPNSTNSSFFSNRINSSSERIDLANNQQTLGVVPIINQQQQQQQATVGVVNQQQQLYHTARPELNMNNTNTGGVDLHAQTFNNNNNNSNVVETSSAPIVDSAVQVPTKIITNEDFQAMIPKHFLTGSQAPQTAGLVDSGGIHVAVQDPLGGHSPMLPPVSVQLGQVTETLTKSTLTETTITRLTDNRLAEVPLIVEVRERLWNLEMIFL